MMHLPRRARNQLHIFIIRKARTPRLLKSLFILDAKSDIRFIPEMRFLNPIFKKQNENELMIFISTRCHIFDVTGLMKIGKLFLFPLKTDVQNVQRSGDRFSPGAIFSNRENYFIVFEMGLQNESYCCHIIYKIAE